MRGGGFSRLGGRFQLLGGFGVGHPFNFCDGRGVDQECRVAKNKIMRHEEVDMSKTWILEAISYWSERIYEGDTGVDWGDGSAKVCCWRCGCERRVQKCHIVPRSLGGPDDVSNLIPLCAMCHDEAPNVADPNCMWEWIKDSHGGMTNLFWIDKAFKEADLTREQTKMIERNAKEFIRIVSNKITSQTGIHFGQNSGGARVTLSTWVWVMRESIKEIERSGS